MYAKDILYVQSNLYKDVTFWTKKNVLFKVRWPLQRASFHMQFSMAGEDKGDVFI
jgi:hypothetical protein